MKNNKSPYSSLASLAFLAVGCLLCGCGSDIEPQITPETKAGELSLQKLIIALKANKDPEKMLAEKYDLEKFLSEKLERPVEVIIPTDSATVVESFRNGTLDLGYLSSTDAARNLDQNTASILLVHLKNGKPHYQSIWLSLKEKNYQSIIDLKNRPVAFAKRSSTSGFLIPTWDMAQKGLVGPDSSLTDYFSQTIYGTGYESAVKKVLSGEVEAAAVSDYVFRGDNKYLSDKEKAQLKVIQEQGPVPAHTLCVRATLSENDRKFLEKTFLEMNEENPELRDRIFNGELVVVDQNQHLRVTREAIEVEKTLKP
ncbi:MAG: phosphate/phosphite/phosphonate ABC transporter substrate-binding protein [Verrucomicrobiota bacterium]|nr:phosphate/phosphite/phosphonate ABC transporter substrate-binding protein [Verrucomicrobiota bacterium]